VAVGSTATIVKVIIAFVAASSRTTLDSMLWPLHFHIDPGPGFWKQLVVLYIIRFEQQFRGFPQS
jgi:hypothetical protein